MQRSSNHNTTLIILLSILTVVIQFSAYYLLDPIWITFGLTSLIILLFSNTLLQLSLSYESCFSYSLLNLFISFIIIFLSYFEGKDSFLHFNSYFLVFIALNWVIPTLYCILRCLFDKRTRYTHFNRFFRNSSIIFLVMYAGILVYKLFLHNEDSVSNQTAMQSFNFIPFLTLATLIEDYINGSVSIQIIFTYLAQSILLYLPYGFYLILILRHTSRFTRFIVLLIFPLLIVILQTIFGIGSGSVDAIILGTLGGFIGALCYHLLNHIFQSVTDDDFLFERSHYSFYGNSLHF